MHSTKISLKMYFECTGQCERGSFLDFSHLFISPDSMEAFDRDRFGTIIKFHETKTVSTPHREDPASLLRRGDLFYHCFDVAWFCARPKHDLEMFENVFHKGSQVGTSIPGWRRRGRVTRLNNTAFPAIFVEGPAVLVLPTVSFD
jgi:hypothetical protein